MTTAAELAALEQRAQAEAVVEVGKASATLAEAEDVFRQAVGGMDRAMHAAHMAGVPIDVVRQHALSNDALHSLAIGQIFVLAADEARRDAMAAAVDAEAAAIEG